MNNYFSTCKTLKEAKTLYHTLMMENHPDKGGSVETSKEINLAFEAFCKRYMGDAFTVYANETGRTVYADVNTFAAMLHKIIDLNCTIEVIGYWIYCTDSYAVKDTLKGLGFWFSKKHKAWIYSGSAKKRIASKLTTDDVRALKGFEVIKEYAEVRGIGA